MDTLANLMKAVQQPERGQDQKTFASVVGVESLAKHVTEPW